MDQREEYVPPIPGTYDENFITPESRYQNEQIVRNALLCETDLRGWFCADAERQVASEAWKAGAKRLIMSAFDNSKVLAWLDSQREGSLTTFESVIHFRILLNLFHASVKPSDRKNPALITFDDALVWNYKHYISRASGMKEREMQGKFSMENKSEQTIRQINAPQEQKGGIGGALGGLMGR